MSVVDPAKAGLDRIQLQRLVTTWADKDENGELALDIEFLLSLSRGSVTGVGT